MDRQELESLRAQMAAIDRAQGVVEFELDGTIVSVNKNFLDILGYSLDEVRGKHHRMFVDPGYAAGPAYRAMWELLGRGEWHAGQFKRIGKDGREVWVQASYNPILDSNGKPYKVVKYASDVTEQVLMSQQLVAAVQETKATIDAASHGDLTRRIGTDGKTGDVAVLCAGVNSLLEAISAIVEEVNATVELGQQGDLTARISLEGKVGAFEHLSTGINSMVENMMQVVKQIKNAAHEVENGAEEISQGQRQPLAAHRGAGLEPRGDRLRRWRR